ncbi:universal stress protein [Nonomuraea sp. PA05]|uniref:universal stress protein n=1 Tax=Nonomuraea sp. PA05 TaxID=2604466 RepID=UPI003983797C
MVDRLAGQSASGQCLVLGSRGLGGFAGLVLGSVGLAVAGHAEGPVVVVRSATTDRCSHWSWWATTDPAPPGRPCSTRPRRGLRRPLRRLLRGGVPCRAGTAVVRPRRVQS